MTAELVQITHGQVRDSIAIARSHGEKFFEQIVWQIENEVWTVLGYQSWDEMREAEYSDMGVVAPRADRPELVSRLRRKGLTQKQIGDTLGVHRETVSNDLRSMSDSDIEDGEPETITNSRGQQRPAAYAKVTETTKTETYIDGATGEVVGPPKRDPGTPRRKPLRDGFRDASLDLDKIVRRFQNLVADDRFPKNKNEVTRYRNDLARANEALQRLIDQF